MKSFFKTLSTEDQAAYMRINFLYKILSLESKEVFFETNEVQKYLNLTELSDDKNNLRQID